MAEMWLAQLHEEGVPERRIQQCQCDARDGDLAHCAPPFRVRRPQNVFECQAGQDRPAEIVGVHKRGGQQQDRGPAQHRLFRAQTRTASVSALTIRKQNEYHIASRPK